MSNFAINDIVARQIAREGREKRVIAKLEREMVKAQSLRISTNNFNASAISSSTSDNKSDDRSAE